MLQLFIRKYVLGVLVWFIYKTLSLTWKIEISEPDDMVDDLKNRRHVVLAHWHGDEIPLINFASRYRIATIASTSKDGEMMTTVLKLLGAKVTRGSSTRGGVGALKGLIRLAKAGYNSSFAVDGPKGPIYQVKPGVFEHTKILTGNIYAAGLACDRKWTFEKAWNKAYLPKPFAKIVVVWVSTNIQVTRDQDAREPRLASGLSEALHNAKAIARKKIDA